ncbi:MAG: Crp/Fnr family transcriptional regulator [Acidimicrobiales bacterium]
MSRKPQWPDSLRDLELFADCSPAELRRIGSLFTMLSVDAGTVLMTEGTFGFEFLIIADGHAQVTLGRGRGAHVVAELGRGQFAGEMSLLSQVRRTATVTATTPLTIYVCNAAEFASLLDAAPGVAEKIKQIAGSRSAELRQAA